jgi:hypothetical protein
MIYRRKYVHPWPALSAEHALTRQRLKTISQEHLVDTAASDAFWQNILIR